KKVLKQAIQIYGVLGSYECKVVKNDKFRLYASLMQGENTYQIKSYTPKHSCSKGLHNKNITSTFLSQRYMSKIKDDPKIKKTTLQLEVHRELGYE
ncbi:PREDICTED: LOC110786475, partial [Prunus dulcis]